MRKKSSAFYKPETVMSIHGWNSDRQWQLKISASLSALNFKTIPYTYGRKIFSIFPCQISREVSRFRDWYFSIANNRNYNIDINKPYHRPSIIAHSLGSWIIAKALIKYQEIKFDKIFLVGSIIPSDFDWFKLILNDQVNNVIYEKSTKDNVVLLSPLFTGSSKTCTRHGFNQKSSLIHEENLEYFGHSDFNYEQHFIQILNKYMKEIPHQIKAVYGSQLDRGEISKYFSDILNIDNEVYNDSLYQASPISIEIGLEWFDAEPDIWTFVEDAYNGTIYGYINAVPVDEKTYLEFVSGKLREHEIKQRHIVDYTNCKSYNLLILSVAIKNEKLLSNSPYKSKITEILMMAFLNKHLRNESKLRKFAAVAWTASGKKLCEGFAMDPITSGDGEHTVYQFDMEKLTANQNNFRTNPNFMAKWFYNNYALKDRELKKNHKKVYLLNF